ncbi:unnamed protein product [Parnassius apollo]|uniref:(apollo) hypothetical protein n=1 Tax=Parnassius apollo TaxID=110799 RepID=A0A8S3YEW3_PARAO|nr:unnamed protein product [Parnassius apollo]
MTLMMFSTFQEQQERPQTVPVCADLTAGAAGVSRSSTGVCGSHCRFRNSGAGVDSRTWLVLLQAAVQRDAARLYYCTTGLQLGVVCCCRDRHYVTSAAAEFGTTSQVLLQSLTPRHKCYCRDLHDMIYARSFTSWTVNVYF